MTVKIIANDKGNPPGVLEAYAEHETRTEGEL
jgi:hypothetical protein